MKKSILILSGGLDSTVSSWIAREKSKPILALTFLYGQKAALREQEAAARIARHLNVPHHVMTFPWLGELTQSALVSSSTSLPSPRTDELDDFAKSQKTANAVWVPNRNGLFLNIAACVAESKGADLLITGFNAEEGITFPDNSAPFINAANEFFWYSTQNRVKVVSHTLQLNKKEIAQLANELRIPLKDIWFCYEGGPTPCRRCESCQRDFRAFREAQIEDPWRSL